MGRIYADGGTSFKPNNGNAEMGLGIIRQHAEPAKRETIFDEAERLIHKDRVSQYGPPDEHHGTTAAVFSLLMRRKYPDFPDLDAGDIDMFFMGDKLVREAYKHKRDNLVDMVAYAALKHRMEDENA